MMNLVLEPSWKNQLEKELEKPYFLNLQKFLQTERSRGKVIFPPEELIFEAFNQTPFSKLKVVILGQDPYHGVGQAHGLSFSVPKNCPLPPSLRNIYKELTSDLKWEPPGHGYLGQWAENGVLLLNTCLTVESGLAGSHQMQGWEEFTDRVLEVINEKKDHIVFMLWGGLAQKKGKKLDEKKHLVLKAPHPSPLSAYRGFGGCRHFSKCNQYLEDKGKGPINWNL